jgi:hypothetical protein
MAKVKKAELVKNIKALNKKKLTKAVSVKGDVEDMTEDFISAIEDIDDNNKIDDVPEKVIDFYEGLIDDDDDDEKADKGKDKKSKKSGGKKKAAKDDDDDDDDDDESDSDLADELEEMSLKELKAYVKDNSIKIDGKVTKKTRDSVIEQILGEIEGSDDDDDDDDDEENGVDLSELSLKELKAKAKEVGYDGKVTKKTRDKAEEAIAELLAGGADDEDDEDDDDEDEVDLSELSLKELKAKAKELGYKGKVNKKTRDDVEEALEELMEKGSDDDDDEDEEDEFDLDEADVDEIVEYCSENGIKLSKKQKAYKVKKLRKVVAKKMAAGEKKTDKVADKGKAKGKDRAYPKGIRKNTVNAKLYDLIVEGGEKGCTMKKLATMVAKEKGGKKEVIKYYGVVQRNIARKVAKAEGITITQIHAKSGNEGDQVFVIEED